MQRISNLLIAALLSLFATAAFPAIEGVWDVANRPSLSVTAFGQPIPTRGYAPFPKTMRMTFVVDPAFPNTGTFTSALFSGDWKANKSAVKGTAATGTVEAAVQDLLGQGSFQGIEFSDGRLVNNKNILQGKQLRNGKLKGQFIHTSTWKVNVVRPRRMTVPIKVRLVVPFTAAPHPSE